MNINIRNNIIFNRLHRRTMTERCGLIVGHKDDVGIEVVRLIEVPNMHEDREHYFRISRTHAVQAANKTRLTPLGYWHTHVHDGEEEPSQWDFEQMSRYPHLVGMTYHVPTGTVCWFNNEMIIKKEYQ